MRKENPNTRKKLRAAIYARTAIEDVRSIKKQIFECETRARQIGIVVPADAIYADSAVSGIHVERLTNLQRLLRDAKATPRRFDSLLVAEISRVGRISMQVASVLKSLAEVGVRVIANN